ncbi:MAG: hypothetical protein KA144_11480 [Xanthomonadaceae bacterium]|nr:hypothetical protein [Xanthomonadaceae bacterium]
MEVFEASVKYNDLKGSAAADDADMTDAAEWLKQNGYITDEYVVGISMWAGENHGAHQDPVSVKFLVSSLDGYSSIPEKLESSSVPLSIRVVRVDMSLVDFFALFKRLEITLSNGGLIEGKEFIAISGER